ncbi:Gfo/Idh/MocA family oxidoreductase [Lutibacter sp. B2]|nr:Gfo/Idh/MocA family oxidoreductase [Lutibacter sp. B2]
MRKLKVGVIGAGNMGEKHIRIYKELANDVELIGVFDIDEQRAHNISNQYSTDWFPKIDDLLELVDAVTIAVPTSMHYKYGILCANKNKHILMEKPICQTQKEARELIYVCKINGVSLQIGHIERFNPAITELPRILNNEQIISLDFRRLSPYDQRIFDVDVVHDLMLHDLDIMNWIVDSDYDTIFAQGQCIYSEKNSDYAQALIRFSNNILVSLTASRVTEDKVRMLTIHTKNTYIYVDYLNRIITISRQTNFKLETGYDIQYRQENITEKVYVNMANPLKEEISSFIHSIKNKKTPIIDGFVGLKALEIADKISEIIHE